MVKTDRKSLDNLKKWLVKNEKKTFKSTKMVNKSGQFSWIRVSEFFVGQALFDTHPYSNLECLTFGRGLKEHRMWTSPPVSAKKLDIGTWSLETENSEYLIEILKKPKKGKK